MQDKLTYEFAVIRIVPKVEREEFMNVGVLLFCKRKHYLGIRYYLDEKRLLTFAPDLDLGMLKQYLNAWELVCQGGRKAGPLGGEELPYRFRWLSSYRSSILQCSRPHPGQCSNPEQELEKLFKFYV